MNVFADIPEDAPEDQIFFLDGGVPVRTGNLVGEDPSIDGLKGFADTIGVLSKDAIAKILNEPSRKAGRDRWEAVVWIKNQGRRGSCNAYACASLLEKTRVIRGQQNVKLGPEWLYAQINGGRDRGSLLKDGIQAMERLGVPRSELVPYESYLRSQQKAEATEDAKRFRILKDEYFGISSEEELATALAMNFMCLVACHVTNAWMKLDSDGVVGATDGVGNHAIHLDDVRISSTGEYQFDHAGSWGTRYGQSGRGWTTWRRHYKTTVRYHQFVAVRSTIDDPLGTQLPNRSL
jgi:hypothetical protein